MKKLLTLLLAAAMTVQLAVPAWAEQASAEEDSTEVVEILQAEDTSEKEEETREEEPQEEPQKEEPKEEESQEEESQEEPQEEEPQEEKPQEEEKPEEEALPEEEASVAEDTESSDTEEEGAPVYARVTFHCTPENLILEIHPAEDPETHLEPESGEGTSERVYLMEPGAYDVTASAEGYVSTTDRILVTEDAESQTFPLLLEALDVSDPDAAVENDIPVVQTNLQENGTCVKHRIVIDKAKKVTCTTDGLTEGRHCSVCHEVLVAQEVIPALGHDYDEDGICGNCGGFEREKYEILYLGLEEVEAVNPSPTSGSVYTATTLKNATAKGYTFAGWYMDYTLTEKVTRIPAGNQKDVVLYAKWIPNTYTVKFNGNGSTGGSMKSQVATYDEILELSANTFVRTGYTFGGWKLNKNGRERDFDDCDAVTKLTSTKGGSVTLYAHWYVNSYSIHFDGNEADEGSMDDVVLSYNDTIALPANEFSRTGYSFAGWSTKEDGSGTVYKDKAYVKNLADGNTVPGATLYAKWKPNTYTVTFYANGGSGSTTKQTFTYDKKATLVTPKFTRKGYGIQSWNTEKDGSGEPFALGEKVENLLESGNLNLYAVWGPAKYTVKFDANGGKGEMAPMEGVIYNDFSSSLPANEFVRDGYHFAGWATTKTGKAVFEDGETIGKNLTDKDGATVTLYAVWAVNTYTVRFHPGAEGVTGRMADQTGKKYGASFNLPSNAFKRIGYSFDGWSLEEGGMVEYKNGQKVPCLISKDTEDEAVVDLYAVWKITDYTITYGNVTKEEIKKYGLPEKYTIEEGVALPELARDGYTFGGWYTDSRFTAKSQVDGWEASTLGNKKLYAKWTANTFSVRFRPDADDTTGMMKDVTGKKCGTSLTLPGNSYKRRGYSFVGWSLERNGDVVYKNGQSVKLFVEDGAVVTLYAVWKPITYKIGYSGVTTQERRDFPTTYTVEEPVELPTPERNGYTFQGWTYNGKRITSTNGLAANITVTAKWKR